MGLLSSFWWFYHFVVAGGGSGVYAAGTVHRGEQVEAMYLIGQLHIMCVDGRVSKKERRPLVVARSVKYTIASFSRVDKSLDG